MKKLLIFTIWEVNDDVDLSPESNLWYVRRYESYFDEITHVYLLGQRKVKVESNGNARYVSLGTGRTKLDLLLSPYRLYRFAAKYDPYAYLAVEQVWLFWVTILAKVFLGAKIYLLPITYPEAMYKLTGKSLSSILPIWLERKLISLSYRAADHVITSRNLGSYVKWITDNRLLRSKVIISEAIPESIPSEVFFNSLLEQEKVPHRKSDRRSFDLVYVGRLHREKSVEDLILTMSELKDRGSYVRLVLVGEGSDRDRLIKLTRDHGLLDRIEFVGWKTNAELPKILLNADAFISPSTGGALREAALCGLPVIAYNLDWIEGFLIDGETFLAVTPYDCSEMASKVQLLMDDSDMKERIGENLRSLAWEIWSDKKIPESLKQVFGE